MIDNKVEPLTCSTCLLPNYGNYKQVGTGQCEMCEQWVKRPTLVQRIKKAVRGY